ncbi:MAG: hypothetical protein C4293_13710 [Nitrospiraceae bacterium]
MLVFQVLQELQRFNGRRLAVGALGRFVKVTEGPVLGALDPQVVVVAACAHRRTDDGPAPIGTAFGEP